MLFNKLKNAICRGMYPDTFKDLLEHDLAVAKFKLYEAIREREAWHYQEMHISATIIRLTAKLSDENML